LRFIARTLPGAVVAPYPGFVDPQLATLRDKVPPTERWLYEIKFDGYRMQLHVVRGKPSMYTRSGLNWTPKFATIATAAIDLPVNDAIIDGEAVVQDAKGRSCFSDLQADIADGRLDRMQFSPSTSCISTASTFVPHRSLIASACWPGCSKR
jgi:bifunctional non-homologous end joining protein LigD